MLRIQRSANGHVVFALSGRIEAEDVSELKRLFQLENTDRHLVLDLKDVTLVARDAVEFLVRCEAENILLRNCPAYIREWIGNTAKPSEVHEHDRRVIAQGLGFTEKLIPKGE